MIFKDENGDTYLADEAKDGWVEITPQELDALRAARKVPLDQQIKLDPIEQLRATLAKPGVLDKLLGLLK